MPLDNHTDSPPHTPLSISDNTYEFPESVLPSCFRNVSSCSRCRLRKTRCDQRLPRCQSCEKVGERCVGYDPITKREIPRSYVYFLECRVNYLKRVLIDNNISFKPASAFDEEVMCAVSDLNTGENELAFDKGDRRDKEDVHLIKTADNCPDVDGKDMRPRSFLPGLFPWKASKCDSPRNTSSMLHTATSTTGGTIFESLSSFQSGPNVNSPEILDRELAERLINFYFEYASPQFPVLNKNDFMEVFNRTYSVSVGDRSPRSLYFLYIVFAIGAGIVFDDRRPAKGHGSPSRSAKRRKLSSMCDAQPKDYYVSAIKHLESSLDSSDRLGTLEELQAVVLLAHFSLLQPVAPGPAHMVELAMRTSLDLRLYCEDAPADLMTDSRPLWETAAHEDGMRNLRRRLWWCVYSLDRLVCPYTGRPFSISDQIITTELPSFLESSSVTRTGVFSDSPTLEPITAHYFRLRLLQSEIHQGLQFQRAQRVRQSDKRSFTRMCGSSSFLHDFDSFGSWRKDINHRLDEWKASIPAQNESGSSIPVVLLELDYWQTINQLYRQSLNVPVELVEMLPPGNDIRGSIEEDAEWEDLIYLKVAESSQKVLQIYRLMHHVRLVNYTYLATHSIFLAGMSD
ncbi:Transcription factor [Aspergillus sclerotialis]|uniref:Transcription factor n=1 Tax=Aspergillus sclerotialis TaxID=2070753 RepID=A0A3A2Z7B4_9EURO|nr:Transcription factor [Aspergillus sclerotialis]